MQILFQRRDKILVYRVLLGIAACRARCDIALKFAALGPAHELRGALRVLLARRQIKPRHA